MKAVRWAMGEVEERSTEREHEGASPAVLVKQHASVMARVAMALLGDRSHVEEVLELVAREAGAVTMSSDVPPLVWLLGLVRVTSAGHRSRLPLRTRSDQREVVPATDRADGASAAFSRATLGALKPTERDAVVLCLVGGLDVAGVALACNVDVATAKARLARGLEQLFASEKQDGVAGTRREP
jgi:DNA-directed RNA polymerase specialized sigma24 family protein